MKLLDKSGLEYYTNKVKGTLTDYVKNTDYASSSKGGVIKTNAGYGVGMYLGEIHALTKTYEQYTSGTNSMFISKGTLENVITGKGLVSNTDYASSSTGGVIKSGGYGINVESDGLLSSTVLNYTQYGNANNKYNVSKGTLENVLTARIGDIATAIDLINGESVGD